MPLPSGFVPATGKQNLMTSFNKFLVAEIGGGEVHDGISTALPGGKTFWWFFGYPLTALLFPSISVAEVGLFNRGDIALDRTIRMDPTTGKSIKGSKNQTLIEINCWAKDTASLATAERVVRELRDKIAYVIVNAGEFDEDTSTFVVPPMQIKDFSTLGDPVVGNILFDRSDNAINEKFIVDAVDQNIKRYKLLVRVFWYELV